MCVAVCSRPAGRPFSILIQPVQEKFPCPIKMEQTGISAEGDSTLRTLHSDSKILEKHFFLHTSLRQFLFKIFTNIHHVVLNYQHKCSSAVCRKSLPAFSILHFYSAFGSSTKEIRKIIQFFSRNDLY